MINKKLIPPGPLMTRVSRPIPQSTRKTQANIQLSNVRVVQESFNPVNQGSSTKAIFDSVNNDKNKK